MAHEREHRDGFFQTLGALAGSRQGENQLSRTFKACFDASHAFRERVLGVLADACKTQVKTRDEWECVAELGHDSGGRMDIVLRCQTQPTFILESKVESVLTLVQLKRYRPKTRGGDYLVAVTKSRPEVPLRKLRREGIRALRWQDIHRSLTDPPVSGAVDRFVTSSFADYLVGEDMAYRSTLSTKGLLRAGRLLAASASQKPNVRRVSAREAFGVLDSLAQLVLDLAFDARDEFTTLASWNRFGPVYSRDDGEANLCAGLWRGRSKGTSYKELAWGFSVAKDRSLRFSVWLFSGKHADALESRRFSMKELMSREGSLDRDRVWHVLRTQLRQWKFTVTR